MPSSCLAVKPGVALGAVVVPDGGAGGIGGRASPFGVLSFFGDFGAEGALHWSLRWPWAPHSIQSFALSALGIDDHS